MKSDLSSLRLLATGRLGEDLSREYRKDPALKDLCIDYHPEPDQALLDRYRGLMAFGPPEGLDLSRLRWIHSFGAGADGFLSRRDLSPTVTMTRTLGRLGEKMAEYCLAHLLARLQNLFSLREQQIRGRWQPLPPGFLKGHRVAVLGTGAMGSTVGRLLTASGTETLGINTRGQPADPFTRCLSLDQFKKKPTAVDTLICTLPLTPVTRDILTPDFFRKFHDLHFINTGRGQLVSEATLLRALDTAQLGHATLDVFAAEPLPPDSPLWMRPDVTITPHQAAITDLDDILHSLRVLVSGAGGKTEGRHYVERSRGY